MASLTRDVGDGKLQEVMCVGLKETKRRGEKAKLRERRVTVVVTWLCRSSGLQLSHSNATSLSRAWAIAAT